jgi:hypothetical protein
MLDLRSAALNVRRTATLRGQVYLGQRLASHGVLCFSCNWDRDKSTRGCKGSGFRLQRPHERVACSRGCKSEELLRYTRRRGERYKHDVRPAVTSNCSAHAAGDGHGCDSIDRTASPKRSADGLLFGAAVRHEAAGHRDRHCVPFLEYRFGVVALARDLGQAHASHVRWVNNQHGRTAASWASSACKMGYMSGQENCEVQLRRVHVHARAFSRRSPADQLPLQ